MPTFMSMRITWQAAVVVYSPGHGTDLGCGDGVHGTDLRCGDRLLCVLCATTCLSLSDTLCSQQLL